jgi:alpha-aminoadipate/glutamate carrier protein LysW
MVNCPMCDAVIDVDEEELDEGDSLICEDCGANLSVSSVSPLELTPENDDEDEDEDFDEDDFDDEEDAAYTIVEGTVFHEPGLALPDAKVELRARDDAKAKKQEALTNSRGEFLFRVPAKQAVYVVKATMKGFEPQQAEAPVAGGAASGQERVTVNLVLAPKPK